MSMLDVGSLPKSCTVGRSAARHGRQLTSLELRVVEAHFCSRAFLSCWSLPSMLMEASFTSCTASVTAFLKALMMACTDAQVTQ